MNNSLEEMVNIMEEKAREIDTQELQPLDPEGVVMAEDKRFTFDVIDTPADPLR